MVKEEAAIYILITKPISILFMEILENLILILSIPMRIKNLGQSLVERSEVRRSRSSSGKFFKLNGIKKTDINNA